MPFRPILTQKLRLLWPFCHSGIIFASGRGSMPNSIYGPSPSQFPPFPHFSAIFESNPRPISQMCQWPMSSRFLLLNSCPPIRPQISRIQGAPFLLKMPPKLHPSHSPDSANSNSFSSPLTLDSMPHSQSINDIPIPELDNIIPSGHISRCPECGLPSG